MPTFKKIFIFLMIATINPARTNLQYSPGALEIVNKFGTLKDLLSIAATTAPIFEQIGGVEPIKQYLLTAIQFSEVIATNLEDNSSFLQIKLMNEGKISSVTNLQNSISFFKDPTAKNLGSQLNRRENLTLFINSLFNLISFDTIATLIEPLNLIIDAERLAKSANLEEKNKAISIINFLNSAANQDRSYMQSLTLAKKAPAPYNNSIGKIIENPSIRNLMYTMNILNSDVQGLENYNKLLTADSWISWRKRLAPYEIIQSTPQPRTPRSSTTSPNRQRTRSNSPESPKAQVPTATSSWSSWFKKAPQPTKDLSPQVIYGINQRHMETQTDEEPSAQQTTTSSYSYINPMNLLRRQRRTSSPTRTSTTATVSPITTNAPSEEDFTIIDTPSSTE